MTTITGYAILAIFSSLLLRLLRAILLPPSSFPKGIPVVPIWVSTLGFVTRMGQDEIYKDYIAPRMRKEGVVAIWFGGRWSLLTGSVDMAGEVYTRTDDFVKSGNNEKIPHSVLAYFLGENIISARGENWRRFRGILAPGFRTHWRPSMFKNCVRDLCRIIDAQSYDHVRVNNLVQRLAMDCIGHAAFGQGFQALENPNAPISVAHTILKKSIFKPLYLFFPILDALPIKSRQEARDKIDAMEQLLRGAAKMLDDAHEDQNCNRGPPLIQRLTVAHRNGVLTDEDFRNNLMVIFVAGHENVQQGLTSLLYLLAKHPDIQRKARQEVHAKVVSLSELTDSTHLPPFSYLTKVIKEALRMYPPIPMLINRRTLRPTLLGGKFWIPESTYVGWHAFGVHRDAKHWEDPERFDPERFSDVSMDRFAWVPFAEGGRKCLGMKLALTVMHTITAAILFRYEIFLDPNIQVKMTPGGLLTPVDLRLEFKLYNT
ncbi:cytochrome P450 [Fimicolochytrium jonesii]|uniref:cytochrome P450 n=1 Tax=Fimicolochytrium jonesii TaxID=1396493 RepID=UPI0022FDFBA3|nr:cytochrome P450 [Fimicolochytrium jonesii]KAI8819268.1 cytochrome P450 [Fimicolochytrium jonesii]